MINIIVSKQQMRLIDKSPKKSYDHICRLSPIHIK